MVFDLVFHGGRACAEDRGEVAESRRLLGTCGRLDGLARTERSDIEAFVLLLAEVLDRRVDAARSGRREVLRRVALRKVDALERIVAQLLAHRLLVGVRQLEHLRGGVELAVHLAQEAVLADGHEAGERPLDVTGAERLVELAARSEHRVEGVGSERAVFLLEGLLERRHRRVVRGFPLGEDEVAEPGGGLLALSSDDDVAGGERGRLGEGGERVKRNAHFTLRYLLGRSLHLASCGRPP